MPWLYVQPLFAQNGSWEVAKNDRIGGEMSSLYNQTIQADGKEYFLKFNWRK